MTEELAPILAQTVSARDRLLEELLQNPSGLEWSERYSGCIDTLFHAALDELRRRHSNLPRLCLIATGGYGRRELSPFSDLDITILPVEEGSKALDDALREFYQWMSDQLEPKIGIKVGYAYRLMSDVAALDPVTLTGLLDMRRIAGSHSLFQSFERDIDQNLPAGEFVLEKLNERRAQRAKTHETPLVVEPHLKLGAGGLRCFHAANWIRRAIGDRSVRPSQAFDEVLQTRNILQAISGRPQDVLTRAKQAEMADLLGKDMYQLMSRVGDARLELFEEFERVQTRIGEARYTLARGVYARLGEARIESDGDLGEASVGIRLATQLGLGVERRKFPFAQRANGNAALFAISAGPTTVKNLDRCGILEALLPELTRCRTLLPRDSSHAYTVFEHSVLLLEYLDRAKTHPYLGPLLEGLDNPSWIYLACLLHDIGKFQLGRPHSETGAEMTQRVAERWSLSDEARRTLVWLVKEHLSMAKFVRLRDIALGETVRDLAALVQTQERLDLLTLLTYADIQSVSKDSWTPALEADLIQLHHSTRQTLEGDLKSSGPSLAERQRRLLKQVREEQVSQEEIRAFVNSLPANYLEGATPETLLLHRHWVARAQSGEVTAEFRNERHLAETHMTVCCLDAPGILTKILGVLYALDCSLLSLRACTTSGPLPTVLDQFRIAYSRHPVPEATASQLRANLIEVLSGSTNMEDLLRKSGKDLGQRQTILRYAFHEAGKGHEADTGVLEVNAPRGRGMPFRIARMLSEHGMNIENARVGQWAGNGAATFYLKHSSGAKVTRQEIASVFGF